MSALFRRSTPTIERHCRMPACMPARPLSQAGDAVPAEQGAELETRRRIRPPART
ncbi:MAG: hypothetical protein ACFCUQ_05765 [Kiloniellales bacterium]